MKGRPASRVQFSEQEREHLAGSDFVCLALVIRGLPLTLENWLSVAHPSLTYQELTKRQQAEIPTLLRPVAGSGLVPFKRPTGRAGKTERTLRGLRTAARSYPAIAQLLSDASTELERMQEQRDRVRALCRVVESTLILDNPNGAKAVLGKIDTILSDSRSS